MEAGFLLIHKPAGPTSHDVVDTIRRITGEKKVGHAGTLDPFATGLLIIGIGREATREFPKLVGLDKQYRAIVRFGATTNTYDKTGVVTPITDSKLQITDKEFTGILPHFTGKLLQVPPMFSAKKVGGKKLYELARKGKTIEREPSKIEIYSLKSEGSTSKLATLLVHCSSGTYIRSLAHDMGQALGCGAYLEELERTAIGPFRLAQALRVEALTKENIGQHLQKAHNFLLNISSHSPLSAKGGSAFG